MNFPPTSLVTLFRILRRDGFAFFGKCARYAFSREAWVWLLRGGFQYVNCGTNSRQNGNSLPPDVEIVKNSEWFDADWYLRENLDVRNAGIDPAFHYARFGNSPNRNPGPDFISDEYLTLNPDVRLVGVNSLAHFERHGRTELRPISFLQSSAVVWPAEAIETERIFQRVAPKHRRTVIFAAYSGKACIPDATLCYLRGLRCVSDNIVFVASNPILPKEIDKLNGLVHVAIFKEHGGYDFFSYRIGWEKAKSLGLVDPDVCDELIVCNDSCFAPVFPFDDCFSAMAGRSCDFWGMTANAGFVHTEHIQSFFFVFRRAVLDDGSLARFLESVVPIADKWRVIHRYEAGITQALVEAGHSWDTLVPRSFANDFGMTPTQKPLALMSRYGMPLLKVRAINGYMDDDRDEVLAFVRAKNPELAAAIPPMAPPPDYEILRHLRETHQESFSRKTDLIKSRHSEGSSPVRVLFLVSSASMFPARPLFDAMCRDSEFDARIFVTPDLRWKDCDDGRRACRADLGSSIPADRFIEATPDESGLWPDVIGNFGADIVCYSSPYDISNFRFNPHWAVGRNFLPVYISYSFSTSIHGFGVYARQNYAYFWKVFVECKANAKEYAEHSILNGANAEVVGYVKMDALATATPWPRNGNRKRVLIAPHHSVKGGANDTLALSNFQRYADYFLSLPEKHPEIDFVFRPHPFLFTVLSRKDKWGKSKVDKWISRMKAHPNVRWSDEGDYFPVFASCDAAIQDCGSYLVEWFYTGKPCCYMLKDPSDIDAKFAPLGKECLSHCYIAYDQQAIETFLRDVVEGGNDPKAAERDVFRKTVMLNYPHAAEAALTAIKRDLGMA